MASHSFSFASKLCTTAATAVVLFFLFVIVRPTSSSAQLTPSFTTYVQQQLQPFLVQYNGRRCIVRMRKRVSGRPQPQELAASSSNLSPQYAQLTSKVILNTNQVANVLNDFQTTIPPPPAPTPSGPTTPYQYSYRTRPSYYTTTTEPPTSSSQGVTASDAQVKQNENRYKNWWNKFQDTHDINETSGNSYGFREQQNLRFTPTTQQQQQQSSTTSPQQERQVQVNVNFNRPSPQQFVRLIQQPQTSAVPSSTFPASSTSPSTAPTSQRMLFTDATTAATTTPESLREPDSTPRHSFSWWLTKIPTQPPAATTATPPQTSAPVAVAKYGFFSHRQGSTQEASSTSSTSAAKLNADASQQIINTQLNTNSLSETVPNNRKLFTAGNDNSNQPELEAQDSLVFYSVIKPPGQQPQQQELPHFTAPTELAAQQQQSSRRMFTSTTFQPTQQQSQATRAPSSVIRVEIQPSRQQQAPTFNQFQQAQQSTSTTSVPQQNTASSLTTAALHNSDIERQKYQMQIYRQKMFKVQGFREYFSTTTTTTTAEPTTTTSTETPTTWAPPPINELVRTTWQEFLEHEAPGTLTPDEVKRVVAAQGNLTIFAPDGTVRVDPPNTFASDPFLCRSKKRYVRGPIAWRSCNASAPFLEISDLVVYKDAGIPIDECVTDNIPNGDRCATLQNGVARCVQKYAHYGLIGKDESGKKKHFCFEFPAGCQCQIVKYETVAPTASARSAIPSPSLSPRIPTATNLTIQIVRKVGA